MENKDKVAVYRTLASKVEQLAEFAGVRDLGRYYIPLRFNTCFSSIRGFTFGKALDEFHDAEEFTDDENICVLMQQFAFSLQNTGRMSKSIGLVLSMKEESEVNRRLREVLYGYDPARICEEYGIAASSSKGDEGWKTLSERLHCLYGKDDANRDGSGRRHSKENTLSNLSKYARGVCDAAHFLWADGNRDGARFVGEAILLSHEREWKSNMEAIPQSIASEVYNMGPALVRDFLKECGCTWLAKPDTHIIDVMRLVMDSERENETESIRHNVRKDDVAREVFDIAQAVSAESGDPADKLVTAYQIDKMIWLLCTADFYLDEVSGLKGILQRTLANR